MSAQIQKMASVSELISGCICGLGSIVILGYLAKVTKPGIIDALVAVVFVGAVIWAYLCIARANVDPRWKATIIIATAGICFLDLRFIS